MSERDNREEKESRWLPQELIEAAIQARKARHNFSVQFGKYAEKELPDKEKKLDQSDIENLRRIEALEELLVDIIAGNGILVISDHLQTEPNDILRALKDLGFPDEFLKELEE